MKRLGQSKGFLDYFILLPTKSQLYVNDNFSMAGEFGRPVFVEIKRQKGGKVSPEQEKWSEILSAAGIENAVCYGAEDAIKFIKERL
jgi:hypothetical protein